MYILVYIQVRFQQVSTTFFTFFDDRGQRGCGGTIYFHIVLSDDCSMMPDGAKGLLKLAEETLTIPPKGTPLRPFITAARESAVFFVTETNNNVQSVANTVNKEITPRIESVPTGMDDVMAGARIRPDIKMCAVVGMTALVSSKFGLRSLVRNSAVASAVSGVTFFPDSVTRGWQRMQMKVSNLLK